MGLSLKEVLMLVLSRVEGPVLSRVEGLIDAR